MVANSAQTSAPIHDSSEDGTLFSRSQMVSRILELNPTTTVSFLASFTNESLGHYLARLNIAQQPRPASRELGQGQGRGWIRVGGVPAILCRESDDSTSS